MNRQLLLALFAFLLLNVTSNSQADAQLLGQRYSAQQRAQIRAMPIYDRPNRPFHFYGNAVRRNATPVMPSARVWLPRGESENGSALTIQPSQIIPANKVPNEAPISKDGKRPVASKPKSVDETKNLSRAEIQTLSDTMPLKEPESIDYSSRRVVDQK